MTKEEFKKLASEYLRAELWEELTYSDKYDKCQSFTFAPME